MEYRVLVDENTSPRVAEALRGKGISADHVHEVLRRYPPVHSFFRGPTEP